MKQIFAITKKEVMDNLRDKRSFYTALLTPIGFPLYFAFIIYFMGSIANIDFEKESDLYVSGTEFAPNLIAHLEQNNFKIIEAPSDFKQQVESLKIKAVLEIDNDFGEKLRAGLPAPLKILMTESDTDSTKAFSKIRTVINRYSNSINNRRLMVRGIDINLFDSIDVQSEDVSKEGSSGKIQGLMIPMALIFSMLMGGFYLAIEVTAGEKEKHTLEPLLSLPASRWSAVLGKFFALLIFCLFSLFLGIASCLLIFGILPIEKMPALFSFNIEIISKIILVLVPVAFFMAALLMLISSLTKSTKEAQTYFGGVSLLFIIPSIIMGIKTIPDSMAVFASPIVGHYKLLDMIFKDEAISVANYFISVSATFLISGIFLYLALWLYKQDRILDN